MSASLREQLVQVVVAHLTAAIAPTPLLRQPTVPIPREASPALLLFIESDAVLTHANDRVERALTLKLVALARGDLAFEDVDQLLVIAHAALMSDPNLASLSLGVRELDAEWDAEDADAGAVALPARYEIRYRTHAIDLTQTG
jgi:hypothetical protein